MSSPSPLVRTAKMLFQHGVQHSMRKGVLDRILAVIHSDNAIELLLKDRAKGISTIRQKQIPALLNDLRQDSIIRSLSGDIRLIHEIRNSSYHLGMPADTYTLNYVVRKARKLFSQCGLFPDGGDTADSREEIKDVLTKALGTFIEAKLEAEKKELYISVLLLCSSILEKVLKERFEREALRKFGQDWSESFVDYRSWNLPKLIEILEDWKAFEDPILALDLKRLYEKRNLFVHEPVEVSEEDAEKVLQVALHFAESPQPYFEMVEAMSTEDAIVQALHDYGIPYETKVKFRLGKEVFSSFDFVVPNSSSPVAIIETKLGEIRSVYLKALLFDVELIKRRNPRIKFYMIYSKDKLEEPDIVQIQELSAGITDGIFDLSEIRVMLEQIQENLRMSS